MGNPMGGFIDSVQTGAVTGALTAIGAAAALITVLMTSFPTVKNGQVGVRLLLGRVWVHRRRLEFALFAKIIPSIRCVGGRREVLLLLGFLPVRWGRATRPTVPSVFKVGPGIKFAPFGLAGLEIVSAQARPMGLDGFDTDVRCSDGEIRQWHVIANIVWRVPDQGFMPVRSIVRGQNGLDAQVKILCAQALRSVYDTGGLHEQDLKVADTVLAAMQVLIAARLARLGVELVTLTLTQTAQSFGQMVKDTSMSTSTAYVAATARA